MLTFTPNESSLETIASLHGIAVRPSVLFAGFPVFPVTHVNNGAANGNVNNLGMAFKNAGKYFVNHVVRTTSPISLRNPGFPQSTHPLSPVTWLVHGAIAQEVFG